MRSAASRIGSSMQALASAVSAAGGSSPATGLVQPTWVRQLAPPGQRGTEPRLPAWQQSRGASCSSGGSGFRPMRSDIARQRRLLAAAAAAQPALATEEEEELGAPWDAQAAWSPAPYPRRILQQRRQAQQSGLHLAGATSTAVGLAAAEPALEEVPREHQREQLARLARLALVREHGQLGSRAAPQQLPQLPVPNLGYTCMNLELWQSEGVRTNRCGSP